MRGGVPGFRSAGREAARSDGLTASQADNDRVPAYKTPENPYRRQNAGVSTTSSVKISRRPSSIPRHSTHLLKPLMPV